MNDWFEHKSRSKRFVVRNLTGESVARRITLSSAIRAATLYAVQHNSTAIVVDTWRKEVVHTARCEL